MKITIYYILLLLLIGLITGALLQSRDTMSMQQMLTICVLLGVYVVGISFAGEGKVADERELNHRYTSNRYALVAGTVVISIGILYQLFSHTTDYWLIAGLIAINLVKIVSLIYSNYRH